MKKNFVFMAASLLLLGSCSDDVMNISMDDALAVKDVPVTFGTYTGKNAVTRAGDVTPMTTAQMQTTGFGVFAYNTGTADYTVGGATGQTPNFMYNEKVSGSGWTYSPIKYWPNLSGQADTQNPYSTEANAAAKLSFFAYAPYVSAADLPDNKNITQLVADDDIVDPFVKYMFPTDGKSVDLLWGTADPTTLTGENILGTAQSGTVLTGGVGKVNVNLTKQKKDGKVSFFFKHALSNVGGSSTVTNTVPNPNSDETGNINVKQGGFQAILDINDGSGKKESKTVVTIKNIKIKGKNVAPNGTTGEDENGTTITSDDTGTYVVVGGKLNLATGVWTKIMKKNPAVADGVIDHNVTSPASTAAEQTAASATLSKVLAEPAGISAIGDWTALNTKPLGVLTVAQNVYEDETSPFVFMPGAVPHLDVTVEYIVRTLDDKLTAGWTVTEQKVTKSIDFTEAIKMNKKYNLIMHIGLTDVKFTASVEDWASYNPDPNIDPTDPNYVADPNNPADPANSVDIDVYVPKNVN